MSVEAFFEKVTREYDFILNTEWELTIPSFPDLKFLVNNVNMPFLTLTAEKQNGSGFKYYTGFDAEETLTIEFNETSRLLVWDFFIENWLYKIFDPAERCFTEGMEDKRTFILSLFHREKKSAIFHLINTRILGFQNMDLDYSGGDNIKLSLEFTVEKVVRYDGKNGARIASGLPSTQDTSRDNSQRGRHGGPPMIRAPSTITENYFYN